jgi:hypothetical protein
MNPYNRHLKDGHEFSPAAPSNPSNISENNNNLLPDIASPKVRPQLPVIKKRVISSEDSAKRPIEYNRRIIALNQHLYYDRRQLPGRPGENKENGYNNGIQRRPPLPERYAARLQNPQGRPPVPIPYYRNPVKQVGMAVVGGNKYSVLPQWWG